MPRRRRLPKRRTDLGPLTKLEQLKISRSVRHSEWDGKCCLCWAAGASSCAMDTGRCESWAAVLARTEVTEELLPALTTQLPLLRRWNRP